MFERLKIQNNSCYQAENEFASYARQKVMNPLKNKIKTEEQNDV